MTHKPYYRYWWEGEYYRQAGYQSLINSCDGDARAAATLLMVEKLEKIVEKQVEAISKLKIDKITVWDSNAGTGSGSSTSNFVSSLIKSIPPLQEIASMAGVELPNYLGTMTKEAAGAGEKKSEEVKS